MLSLGGVHHLTGGSKKEGRVTCETMLALVQQRAGRADDRRRRDASSCRPASAPVVNGVREERMRVGCGSATIGIFAQQWHGHVDEVIVVDDHITGVLTEHQAGRFLDMRAGRHPRARPQVDAGALLPGRQSRARLGRHRHHRSARRSSRQIDPEGGLARACAC